ncbi:MAG: tyrosine-type recombinase/integrase [Bacteroidales bacterium]|nr:tyrosine-type recombinase/integrase [Bacteroidales bacterium]
MEGLRTFVEYIKTEKRYSEHTVRAYSDDLNQFLFFINREDPNGSLLNVSRSDIRNWIMYLVKKGCSSRTLRRKLASLKSFYHFLLQRKLIEIDPSEGILLPKLDKKIPDFIKESSIDQLFNQNLFAQNFSGLRDKVVLELFYATGMRLSELTNLKKLDIDLNKGEVKIHGKRSKERIVPLTKTVKTLLYKYLSHVQKQFNNLETDNLILTNKGEPAYPKMIQRLVHKYLLQATTLEKKSPHMLRHTFATHMLNKGADLNAVKELLGHANLAATEIYTHNTYEKLKLIYKQAHPRA